MAIFSRKFTTVLAVDVIVAPPPPPWDEMPPFRLLDVADTAEGVLLDFFLPNQFIFIVFDFVFVCISVSVFFVTVFVLIQTAMTPIILSLVSCRDDYNSVGCKGR